MQKLWWVLCSVLLAVSVGIVARRETMQKLWWVLCSLLLAVSGGPGNHIDPEVDMNHIDPEVDMTPVSAV